MNKLWLIIRREYLIRVKKKSFIIATLLTPLAFGLLIFGSAFLTRSVAEGEKTILVKDESQVFEKRYEARGNLDFTFTQETLEEAKKTYNEAGFDFLVYIPPFSNPNATRHDIQYFSREKLGLTTIERVEGQISGTFKEFKIEQSGIAREVYEAFGVNIEMETACLTKKAQQQ